MRKCKIYLFRAFKSKESQPPLLAFGRDSKVIMGVAALERQNGKTSGFLEVVGMGKLESGQLEGGHHM